MGRCYEFAVAINGGCEHAMVVTPEGGACECPSCGAHCTGKFGGCEAIVAVPGRVPPHLPDSAVPGYFSPPSQRADHAGGSLSEPPGAVDAIEVGNGRGRLPEPIETFATIEELHVAVGELWGAVAEISGAVKDMDGNVQAMGARLADRDADLDTNLKRLDDSYRQLVGRMTTLSKRLEERSGHHSGSSPGVRKLLNWAYGNTNGVDDRRVVQQSRRAGDTGDPSPRTAWPSSTARKR